MRSARLLAALTGLVLAVGLAAPAQATETLAAPMTSRTFGPVLDAPASWERESGCDQTEKKGPKRLRKLLAKTYGEIGSNILRPCSRSDSGHEEGRALDWMVNVRVPEQKAIAESFLTWIQAPDEFGNTAAMARRLGIQYVIWNNSMWRAWSGEWTPYSSCAKKKMRKRAYDSTCHRNHVHVSFSWDGAKGRTSFYTGYVACPAPVDVPDVPDVPGDEYGGVGDWDGDGLPDDLDPPVVEPPVVLGPPVPVVVAATKVLRTRTGYGLASGKCKVHPDVRMDVPLLGVAGLPAAGVTDVTLAVTMLTPDEATELRVWQGGAEPPAEPSLTTTTKVTAGATVTVPVGPDGRVSLELTGGMAHVAVDVLGYSVATPLA